MNNHVDLRQFLKFVFPIILLYGLYVQFNGSSGLGGGFQAGVIVASAFIGRGLSFGAASLSNTLPIQLIRSIGLLGVWMYGGVGILDIILGSNFLAYSLPVAGVTGQLAGSFIVELGVFFTVFSSMLTIYLSLAQILETQ